MPLAILYEGVRSGCPKYLKVFDGPHGPMTRRSKGLFLLPSRLYVGSLQESLPEPVTWLGGWLKNQAVTATPQKRKKAKIHYLREEQLARLVKTVLKEH